MEKPKLSEDQRAYLRAAAEGKLEEIRRSLDRGVPVDVLDSELYLFGLTWDTTALMYAAGNGHLEAVRMLLKAGANVSIKSKASKQDGGGESQALHFAAANGNPAVVEELLTAGADINAQGNWGRTPLTIAAEKGKVEALKLLLKRGAVVNLKSKRKMDMPPLYAAVAGKDVSPEVKKELVDTLVAAGADANAIGDANQTALNRLSSIREIPDEIRARIFETLLKAGGEADHADKSGGTPLEGALLLLKSAKAANLLIGAGADVNRVFALGTPLDIVEKNIDNTRKRLADPALPERWREPLKTELRDFQELLELLKKRGAKKKAELGT